MTHDFERERRTLLRKLGREPVSVNMISYEEATRDLLKEHSPFWSTQQVTRPNAHQWLPGSE